MDRTLVELAAFERDAVDTNKINITGIVDEDTSKNLNPDKLRLFKSIIDNASKKYGFEANYTNMFG